MDLSVFEQKSPAHNEFRSDTFTTPTSSMIQSICSTSLGDAVYNEDDTTKSLECKVAKMAGKPKGLYCVSGTLSNQIAVRANLFQPPYSLICDYRGHIIAHEAGGLPTLSQVLPRPVIPKNGDYLTLEDDILPNFVEDDGEIHSTPTKLICLENTLHGIIMPLEEIKKISDFCKRKQIKLHLDGARLWNASAETGISIEEYCKYFDSISLCLSKTLGAPIGSVLVGDEPFIAKANHFKKQNGGGIRQSGLLAAMAMTAIDENFGKLKQTHQLAKDLGQLCKDNGIVLAHPVDTNFVFIDMAKSKMNLDYFIKALEKAGIKISSSRIAFHYQLSPESVEAVKKVVMETLEYSKAHPVENGSNVYY